MCRSDGDAQNGKVNEFRPGPVECRVLRQFCISDFT